MALRHHFHLIGISALLVASCSLLAGEVLPGAKRVLVLGDSITYDGRYVAWVEAVLLADQPARKLEIINCGLPSETVSGLSEEGHAGGQFPRPCLFERLDRVLRGVKPDTVIACYGMNDGIYKPYEAERARKYQDGMTELRRKVLALPARFIAVTPPIYDPHGPDAVDYNGVLDKYSAWLVDQRKSGWQVIDLHGPMAAALTERRKQDPNFTFASDKVHPNDEGHWVMAKALLAGLGVETVKSADTPQAALTKLKDPSAFLKLVQQRSKLLRDAWLTSTKHTRPGIAAGVPMDQARAKAAELTKAIQEAMK